MFSFSLSTSVSSKVWNCYVQAQLYSEETIEPTSYQKETSCSNTRRANCLLKMSLNCINNNNNCVLCKGEFRYRFSGRSIQNPNRARPLALDQSTAASCWLTASVTGRSSVWAGRRVEERRTVFSTVTWKHTNGPHRLEGECLHREAVVLKHNIR